MGGHQGRAAAVAAATAAFTLGRPRARAGGDRPLLGRLAKRHLQVGGRAGHASQATDRGGGRAGAATARAGKAQREGPLVGAGKGQRAGALAGAGMGQRGGGRARGEGRKKGGAGAGRGGRRRRPQRGLSKGGGNGRRLDDHLPYSRQSAGESSGSCRAHSFRLPIHQEKKPPPRPPATHSFFSGRRELNPLPEPGLRFRIPRPPSALPQLLRWLLFFLVWGSDGSPFRSGASATATASTHRGPLDTGLRGGGGGGARVSCGATTAAFAAATWPVLGAVVAHHWQGRTHGTRLLLAVDAPPLPPRTVRWR